MTDVDVIVLDLDGGPMTGDCLGSILQQSIAPKSVILFDNGSQVRSDQRMLLSGVTFLRSEVNLGFAGGVNEAFRHTEAGLVALINNDVVLDHDWLATVLEAMGDGDVAAAQTALRSGTDAMRIDGAGVDISDGTIRQRGHGAPVGATLPASWGVSATATLYRREALNGRFFDPRFFAYYEDVELCARLHEQGWRTVVIPEIKATHRGSASASRLGRRAVYLRTRNRYFVARLHPGVGRCAALLAEDLKLVARGHGSIRGMIAGLCSPLS